MTSIEQYAFYYCSGLTSVTIPNSVTSIGERAFSGCSGLTSITIPSSVTSIGHCAFLECSGLTSIVIETGNTVYDSRNDCNAIIKTETNELIKGCQNTVIPNTVTCIGGYAFSGCSGLTSITIPSSVTSIEGWAFDSCSGLTSINIPNSVKSIKEWAFSYCSGLTSVTIGNTVTSIGNSAFQSCSSLTSITIPNSVTSIGNYAFYGCSGLTSVTIPSSVTSIGNSAFIECSGLTSITIPSSVTSIGNSAFLWCRGLTSVTIGATPPIAIDSYCFSNRANATLYVPKGSKTAYEAADYWKEFKELIELEPEPISITMATASGAARDMIGYSSEYGLDFTDVKDVKAYIAVAFDKNLVTYLSRINVVPPRTGIVLKTTKPGITVNVPTTEDNVFMANLLIPAVEETVVQPSETIDNVEYTNLMVGKLPSTNTMGFVKFSSPVTTSKKCYLRVPSSFFNASAPAMERGGLEMVFDDEGTTDVTGIRTIEDFTNAEQSTSGDHKVYDLQGRKVTTPKGLVIRNGKLIFVKP